MRRTLLVLLAALVLAVPARAVGNAYLANETSGTVSQYAIGGGGLLSP